MFSSPGAIAIQIGSLNIYWYGITIAIAFLSGLFFTIKIAKDTYKNETIVEHVYNISFYGFIGAILGARLYYILLNTDYYFSNPIEIFQLYKGGLSIHGAILGAFITGSIYTIKNKIQTLKYADLFAFGLLLGQALGRWGNFFNSEAFGKPTELPWKLYIPIESRPEIYSNQEFFHPTFLYESIWNLLILTVLFFFIKKQFIDKHGIIFFSYLILYSIGRILIEGIRLDSVLDIYGIPVAQIASIIIISIGILGIIIISLRSTKKS